MILPNDDNFEGVTGVVFFVTVFDTNILIDRNGLNAWLNNTNNITTTNNNNFSPVLNLPKHIKNVLCDNYVKEI